MATKASSSSENKGPAKITVTELDSPCCCDNGNKDCSDGCPCASKSKDGCLCGKSGINEKECNCCAHRPKKTLSAETVEVIISGDGAADVIATTHTITESTAPVADTTATSLPPAAATGGSETATATTATTPSPETVASASKTDSDKAPISSPEAATSATGTPPQPSAQPVAKDPDTIAPPAGTPPKPAVQPAASAPETAAPTVDTSHPADAPATNVPDTLITDDQQAQEAANKNGQGFVDAASQIVRDAEHLIDDLFGLHLHNRQAGQSTGEQKEPANLGSKGDKA